MHGFYYSFFAAVYLPASPNRQRAADLAPDTLALLFQPLVLSGAGGLTLKIKTASITDKNTEAQS
jgi:hypothetical protein